MDNPFETKHYKLYDKAITYYGNSYRFNLWDEQSNRKTNEIISLFNGVKFVETALKAVLLLNKNNIPQIYNLRTLFKTCRDSGIATPRLTIKYTKLIPFMVEKYPGFQTKHELSEDEKRRFRSDMVRIRIWLDGLFEIDMEPTI